MVNIVVFHAVDVGSIPGQLVFSFFFFFFFVVKPKCSQVVLYLLEIFLKNFFKSFERNNIYREFGLNI